MTTFPVDVSDVPFAPPADIVLDVPVPPSVNRTRKIDRAASRKVEAWEKAADSWLMWSGQFRKAKASGPVDRFELTIILSEEKCRLDCDNPIKSAIDYLRRLELIPNDDPKHMRKLTVLWGHAPEGARLILRRAA